MASRNFFILSEPNISEGLGGFMPQGMISRFSMPEGVTAFLYGILSASMFVRPVLLGTAKFL